VQTEGDTDDMAVYVGQGRILSCVMPKRKPLFYCSEQAMNYAQQMAVHDVCWVQMLREQGVELYDLNEVAESYQKREVGDGLGQD